MKSLIVLIVKSTTKKTAFIVVNFLTGFLFFRDFPLPVKKIYSFSFDNEIQNVN